MAALQANGWVVLLPFGENSRYDLVVDDKGVLSRIQCKTGRLREGCIRFKPCSTYAHHQTTSRARAYHGEVDYIGVHCPETGGVYLIPINELPVTNKATLRIRPTRNHQRKHIRLASQYQIASVVIKPARR